MSVEEPLYVSRVRFSDFNLLLFEISFELNIYYDNFYVINVTKNLACDLVLMVYLPILFMSYTYMYFTSICD